MKIKEGFVLKAISDSNIVVPLGSRVVDFGAVIKLSETGAFLWQKLLEDVTVEQLVYAMVSEYDVDDNTAKKDIENFINKLKKADLLE